MDLTPGERTVLNQIRALYAIEARRDHQIKALMMQWPPSHHATYQHAYASLVAKRLLEDFGTQLFKLTDAGLSAIGVMPKPQPLPQPRPRPVDERSSVPAAPPAAKAGGGVLSRFLKKITATRA